MENEYATFIDRYNWDDYSDYEVHSTDTKTVANQMPILNFFYELIFGKTEIKAKYNKRYR